jgi:hypothetical protein
MKFRVREGPWRTLFEGSFEEHEIGVYLNPESVLLVSILEKKNDRVVGAVIELYATGEVEDFIETFPGEAVMLVRHDKKHTTKFFILSVPPSYARYTESAFCDEVEKLLEKLKENSKIVKEVSRAYDLDLVELHEASERIKNQFFAEPLSIPLLGLKGLEAEVKEGAKPVFGEVLLGLTRNNIVVKEPLSLFYRTIVHGSSEKDRKHVMHLIIEGSLMSNAPVVAFDWKEDFKGLSAPAKDLSELKRFKVEVDPIGFPVKEFKAREDVKVDLNLIDPAGLLELYGTGNNKASKELIKVLGEEKLASMEQAISKVKRLPVTENLSQYDIYKMIRILKVINNSYPGLFNGKNNIEEISKNWHKSIGRLGRISLEGLDKRSALMIVHSIIKGIYLFYEKTGSVKKINSTVLLSNAEKIISRNTETILGKQVIELLNAMKEVGVIAVIESDKMSDLMEEAIAKREAEIHVISREDVGLKLANRKQYRLSLRPGLSSCTEK